DDPWRHAGTVAAGGVLVQVLAQSVGTGLGLLLRRPVVACLATIALPTGLWLLLGGVASLRPAQSWLTPYAVASPLLAGGMTGQNWAQWLVVVALWGVGLNVLGAAVVHSRRAAR
ncbi:hypothetical protein ACFQ0D_33835, partial [Micromonospora zhanjiangensis]